MDQATARYGTHALSCTLVHSFEGNRTLDVAINTVARRLMPWVAGIRKSCNRRVSNGSFLSRWNGNMAIHVRCLWRWHVALFLPTLVEFARENAARPQPLLCLFSTVVHLSTFLDTTHVPATNKRRRPPTAARRARPPCAYPKRTRTPRSSIPKTRRNKRRTADIWRRGA